ncbi:unnamed protein product [Hydatigera taeniaeformis]|uniref:G_PROTEIN_RECEP_F1_2 domain-containing protein n=1 Tax=Hydatigena taeniaeformis TaxID=6205 RepID=A0A0R3X274_HYDTA|nr:unnamed protein product [Hydatigera taeniaeformis]
MTRTLFIYRILACVASLLVLLCSTLPQLVLAVANPPREGNIDQLWGWCHTFVYMDHTTRSFATYLIVVPYVLFFWDFLFSEVVPRRRLVMQHIFRGVLMSALPIALFSSLIAVPLVAFRYERLWNGTHDVCHSSISGTKTFLAFDFAVTRVAPMLIIIVVTSAFLIWLPRHHYGVFYEPLTFLFLMAPVVFVEATIYIACYMDVVHYLFNEHFANVLLIFYAFYHMSFSSTFVLATLRSVVTEIRRERKARKQFLSGEEPRGDERRNARRSNVMHGLQRQFSVVFRWRSECAEDELHLEDHVKSKKPEIDRSATYKKPILESQDVNFSAKPLFNVSASDSDRARFRGDSPMGNFGKEPYLVFKAPESHVESVSCSIDSVVHGLQHQIHQTGHNTDSHKNTSHQSENDILLTASPPRNLQKLP